MGNDGVAGMKPGLYGVVSERQGEEKAGSKPDAHFDLVELRSIVFSYKGRIENRPVGRGIELLDKRDALGDTVFLEDVLPDNEEFEASIVVRKKA